MYHKTNVQGLQNFLRDKLPTWANNGGCVEDIWKNFDIIFEGIKSFVLHKILKPNPDPEYYNKEVRRLKVKVRRAYSKRKLGDHYQEELRKLSKKLLTAKREAQETFLSSILQDEGKFWSEFYKFVNTRKGNRESIPSIKDCKGGHITDPVVKANFLTLILLTWTIWRAPTNTIKWRMGFNSVFKALNNYYASIFSRERVIPDLFPIHSDRSFTINVGMIRKRLAIVGGKKIRMTKRHPRRLTANGW